MGQGLRLCFTAKGPGSILAREQRSHELCCMSKSKERKKTKVIRQLKAMCPSGWSLDRGGGV